MPDEISVQAGHADGPDTSTQGGRDAPPAPTVLRGMGMGLADAVPGVSGGTMALILGIHPRLVRAIASIDVPLIKASLGRERFTAWKAADMHFLALLAAGIGVGILLGAQVLDLAMGRYPVMLMALLFGLVAASIPIPAAVPDWRWSDLLLAAATALLAFTIGVVSGIVAPQALWFLPIAGAIAACAMILPGISGSYILLLMGLYPTIIGAIADLRIGIIVLVGSGAALGLAAFSRGLRTMLDRFRGPTHAAMVGLLAGSLIRLWPWRDDVGFAMGQAAAPTSVLPFIFVALGMVLGIGIGRLPQAQRE